MISILLVEDDEVDRMAFERFVRTEGLDYDFSTAASVASAREVLASGDFDVVLLDYNLGDGTAFDLIGEGIDAPVIIITGANEINLAVAAMKAGAYDFLLKDQERDYLHLLPLAVDSAIRRKQAEDTTRVLSHALMSSSEAIFVTDLDDRITFANNAAGVLYGYSPDELLGEDVGVIGDIGEVGGRGEYLHQRRNGDRFPAVLSRSAVEDDTGRAVAYVVMVRDITERKRYEEELERINRELEGYAHTVSHDLKGPLTATTLAASVLHNLIEDSGLADGEEIGELLGVIDNNVWKSAALIDDLLALAEGGQTPKDVEPVDIAQVVDRVLEECAGIILEKGAATEVEGPLGTVLGSPAHMYQLFSNLIGNCVKHCESAAPVIRVVALESGAPGEHRFLVRDNGAGFSPEDIDKIFAPFFKGKSGGTGIGLSTVEKIVHVYGGTIRAYNDDGACFDFTVNDYRPD